MEDSRKAHTSSRLKMVSLGILLWIHGCAVGPCAKELQSDKSSLTGALVTAPPKEVEEMMKNKVTPATDRVYIFVLDGTKQCERNSPFPKEKFLNELKEAGIEVFEIIHSHAPLLFPQVCGADTGQAYRIQIKKDDLPKAIKLGYREWLE